MVELSAIGEPEVQLALSEREKEVLFLAGDGLTDKEIARKLGIGAKTVRTYWDRMRAKLGAASRTEVLAKALQSAYETLAESEQQLRTFVEHMPVVFHAFDEEQRILVVNHEFERLTGYGSDELQNTDKLYQQAIPDEEQRRQQLEMFGQASGDYRDFETDLICEDGQSKTIAWSSTAKEFPIPGWASWAIGVDVTERRKARRALEQSEANYRNLLESSSQGVWLIDTEQRTIFANQRLADMLGCTVEEIMNASDAFFHDDESREIMRELIGTGPVAGSRTYFTFKFKRKDGNDLWAHVDVSPLRDLNGGLAGHAAILMDVSRAKLLEKANRQLHDAVRAILSVSGVGYLRFDRSMCCVEEHMPEGVDAAAFHGMTCEDLATVLRPFAAWSAGFKQVYQNGETVSFRTKIGPDDSAKSYEVTLVPEPTTQQSVGYVLAILSPAKQGK